MKTGKAHVDKLNEVISGPASQEEPATGESGNLNSENVIDWQELENRVGDKKLIEEMIPVFLNSNIERIELLAEAVKTANAEDIHFLSHAVKGAAASMGAKPLSEAAYKLELAGKESKVEKFESLFENLQTEFGKVKNICFKG